MKIIKLSEVDLCATNGVKSQGDVYINVENISKIVRINYYGSLFTRVDYAVGASERSVCVSQSPIEILERITPWYKKVFNKLNIKKYGEIF